jgi:hypothetical protein
MIRKEIFLVGWLLATACLKQVDETGSGPKAKITIINAALDSAPITLLLDGIKINETPIAYGEYSGTADDSYLKAAPGVRSTILQVGAATTGNGKFLDWSPSGYYTLIQYDTAVDNAAPVLLVKDVITANDSLAKGRFINCLASPDSLSLWLIGAKDTVKIATKTTFLGNSNAFSSAFNVSFKPGVRRIELINQQGVVLFKEDAMFSEKLNYSFVAFGEKSGSGVRAPKVSKLVQLN